LTGKALTFFRRLFSVIHEAPLFPSNADFNQISLVLAKCRKISSVAEFLAQSLVASYFPFWDNKPTFYNRTFEKLDCGKERDD
jgi:hypothetical protein